MSLRQQFGGGKVLGAFNESTVPGTVVHGTITEVDIAQAREFRRDGQPGELLYHDDGKPKLQVVVTVDTGVKGHAGPDDDGKRRFYIKTWYKSDREAMFAALDAADNADDFEVGGTFAGQFLGKLNGNAWNSFKYEYRRPSKIGQAGLLDKPAEATPPAQPTLPSAPAEPEASKATPPAPASSPAASAPVVTPETATAVRGLIAAGMDDATISAAFPGVKRELIAALRNAAALAGA